MSPARPARRPKRRSERHDPSPLEPAVIRLADPGLLARLEAGRVLRWHKTIPRMAPEAVAALFERYLERVPGDRPRIVIDPCCGNGVALAVLQIAYPAHVRRLVGTDASELAIRVTNENLAMLRDPAALEERIARLVERATSTGGPRVEAAVADARELLKALPRSRPPARVEACDALSDPWPEERADLILVDPPYHRRSSWIGSARPVAEDLGRFLARARGALGTEGRIALALDPAEPLPEVARLEIEDRVDLGRRAGWLLRPRPEVPPTSEP